MMKRILILFLFFLSACSYFFALSAQAAANEIVVIENDWPPYYFGGRPGTPPGFARELLDACLSRTEYKATYRFYPVKRMYSYLEKGHIDLALFSYNRSREKMVFYGREPLFSSGYRPVVRKDSDIVIRSLKDFDALRLGHLAGLRYSPEFLQYVQKRKDEGTLVTTTNGVGSLRMLLEGVIDVFVDTRDTVVWRAAEMGVADRIKLLEYDIKTSEYFVTLSKKSYRIAEPVQLLHGLDSCFAEMKKNGSYGKIAERYSIYEVPVQ